MIMSVCRKCRVQKDIQSFRLRRNGKPMAHCAKCMEEESVAQRMKSIQKKSKFRWSHGVTPTKEDRRAINEREWKLKCNKCLNKFPRSFFDVRRDGVIKSWCRACCSKESVRCMTKEATPWGYDSRLKYSISADGRETKRARKVRQQKEALAGAVVRLQAQPDKSFTDPKYAITLIDKQYNGMSYASRNLTLKLMGFENYGQYLSSDLWDRVRKKVFASKGTRCWLCPGRGTQIHHNRYHLNDLVGKVIDFMFPICDQCHHLVEFDDKGEKRHLHQAMPEFNNRAIAWMESKYGIGIT